MRSSPLQAEIIASLFVGLVGAGLSCSDKPAAHTSPPPLREPAPVELPTLNPTCPPPLNPVDTTAPRVVVGSGTAESCDEAALAAAVSGGGIITFACGSEPVTIALSRELRITQDTVLDGGGRVTLSGQGQTRILSLIAAGEKLSPRLTVQNLRLIRGHVSGSRPPGDSSLGGAAIYRLGGTLQVHSCQFEDNQAADSGADQAGGAIYARGGGPTTIVGSSFRNNSASNGGAIGVVAHPLQLVNSVLYGNRATGRGGKLGSGGLGGGLLVESEGSPVTLCAVLARDNQAQADGGGIYHRGTQRERLSIERSTLRKNLILTNPASAGGGLYAAGVTAQLAVSSLVDNVAGRGGGLYIEAGVLDLLNLTLAGNIASSGAGGGLAIGEGVSGQIGHSTLIQNQAGSAAGIGGGIAGGSLAITLQNSIVVDNQVGDGSGAISCSAKLAAAGINFQWPVKRAGGGSDDPSALCADGVRTENPAMWFGPDGGTEATHLLVWPFYCGGPGYFTRTTGCPGVDGLGRPRTASCRVGAAEHCWID